jgi:hypothetical protein
MDIPPPPRLRKDVTSTKLLHAKALIVKAIESYINEGKGIPEELFCFAATVHTGRAFKCYVIWRIGDGWYEKREYSDGEIRVRPLNIETT